MRILVIEDEARIQSFLARGLEAEGYTVVARRRRARGARRWRSRARWDLVVLDLLLPGARTAFEVLRRAAREQAGAAGR